MKELPEGSVIIEQDLKNLPEGSEIVQSTDPLENVQRGLDIGAAYAKGFGWGATPKVASAIGTTIAKPILEGIEFAGGPQAPSYSDLYKHGVDIYSAPAQRASVRDPALSALAEGGGAVTSAIMAGGLKPVQQAQKFISGAPITKTMPLAEKAMRLFGKTARSALAGEAGYRVYKAGESDVGKEVESLTEGPPVGAMLGAAAPLAGTALKAGAEAITPKVSEGLLDIATKANQYDIPVSLDQISDTKLMKNIQKVSQELPGSGYDDFRDYQVKKWQKALINTFGGSGDEFTPQMMDKSFKSLGRQFDKFGKGKTFTIDDTFKAYVDELLEETPRTIGREGYDALKDTIDNVVYRNIKNGEISGEALGFVRNKINELARKTKIGGLDEYYRDLEGGIIDIMTQGDLAAKESFKNLKKQYKNLIAVEPLAAKAKGGKISPTLLNNRVSKIYGRQHVRGKSGEIGDLARIGNELLGQLGGSDTTEKMLYTGMATGAGFFEPTSTITALGLNRAYQKYLNQNQNIIQKTLEKEFLRKHAPEALEKGAEYLTKGK